MSGQIYASDIELGGYYLPASDVSVGDVYLDHISLGMAWEFEEFLAGGEETFPPVSLHFEDRSSPTGGGELGNTYYEVTHWFQPENFLVTGSALSFSGTHELLGDIRFEGSFDAGQVAAMQNGDPHLAETALTGTMHIGEAVFEDVHFQGWLGD